MSPRVLPRWERVDPRPWTKTSARWWHPSGWRLEHCDHPTALTPWALYAPDGRLVLTGVMHREAPNPDHGTAWPTLLEAMTYVRDALEPTRAAERAAAHEAIRRWHARRPQGGCR